ncbi:aminoglycoside phosphotransferase family protein (plasmid) [Streptomyces sp. NBC_00853]|uniref:phosphotransferase family protein n=1 Tax=Streptomyces sp. NBC_00853 TaxID=2903681 RepID=UPI002F915249|nr:aminoglycoside phosphotransferase family protein [Streptomyces sp. NBC_00853]
MTWTDIAIIDPSGNWVAQLERPSRVQMTSRLQDDPAAVVKAVEDQLDLEVSFIRFVNGFVETEYRGPFDGLTWKPRTGDGSSERAPWERAGWIDEVLHRIDPPLAKQGLARHGLPIDARRTFISAILKVRTECRDVWYKEYRSLFRREPHVVEWLAKHVGAAVPGVLAAGDTWWLAEEFPEERPQAVEDPLEALARVQIATSGRGDEIVALGCPEWTLGQIVSRAAAVSERDDLIGREDANLIRSLLSRLEYAAEMVDRTGIPNTIVHGDFHSENVRWTDIGWFLFDWTDACVAHPFIDLAVALRYESVGSRAQRSAAYEAVWSEAFPRENVRRALKFTDAIGAAFQLVNYAEIIDSFEHPVNEGESLALRDWVRRIEASLTSN